MVHEMAAAIKALEVSKKQFKGKKPAKVQLSIGRLSTYTKEGLLYYIDELKEKYNLGKCRFSAKYGGGTDLKITGVEFHGKKGKKGH